MSGTLFPEYPIVKGIEAWSVIMELYMEIFVSLVNCSFGHWSPNPSK